MNTEDNIKHTFDTLNLLVSPKDDLHMAAYLSHIVDVFILSAGPEVIMKIFEPKDSISISYVQSLVDQRMEDSRVSLALLASTTREDMIKAFKSHLNEGKH